MAPTVRELVFVLADLLYRPLTSIEILPGSLEDWMNMDMPPYSEVVSLDFPFVLLDNNLGIPKKTLSALYITAAHMPWLSTTETHITSAATAIIILLNPAHQTALNKRKQLIQEGHLSAEKELLLIELISRGSPECGKQSMIWDHRRWCLRKLFGTLEAKRNAPSLKEWASSEEVKALPKMHPKSINHEIAIVYRTCETYPRNYHAWSYWHFLINVCHASLVYSPEGTAAVNQEYFGIIIQEYTRLQEWIDRHVSDYSAMHQLCQTQSLIQYLNSNQLNGIGQAIIPLKPLADHAMSLISSYPNHEALWMYLRLSLLDLPSDVRSKFLSQIKAQEVYNDNLQAKRLFAWYAGKVQTSSRLMMPSVSQV